MGIEFATRQPLITVQIIQSEQFQDVGRMLHVHQTPTTHCEPGSYGFTGVISPQQFTAYLLQAALWEPS